MAATRDLAFHGPTGYGPIGRDLVTGARKATCAYPLARGLAGCPRHAGSRWRWIIGGYRCAPPEPCAAEPIACPWFRGTHGHSEGPVCERHLAIADEEGLFVPITPGVERRPDGTWVILPGALYEGPD